MCRNRYVQVFDKRESRCLQSTGPEVTSIYWFRQPVRLPTPSVANRERHVKTPSISTVCDAYWAISNRTKVPCIGYQVVGYFDGTIIWQPNTTISYNRCDTSGAQPRGLNWDSEQSHSRSSGLRPKYRAISVDRILLMTSAVFRSDKEGVDYNLSSSR